MISSAGILGYYLFSVLSLGAIPLLYAVFRESNLPPLIPGLRAGINLIFLNLVLSYFLLVKQAFRVRFSKKWAFFFVLAGFFLCALPPVFSGDLYEYLMRGRILGIYHQSPYAHVPAEFPGDLFFERSTWKTFPFDYGPLEAYLVGLSSLPFSDSVRGTAAFYKILQLAFIVLMFVWTRTLAKKTDEKSPDTAALLVILNPLLIVRALIDGHNDSLMIAFSIASVFYLLEKKYTRAFFLWTLSFLIKYSAVLILPLLVLRALKDRIAETRRFPWKEILRHLFLNGAWVVLAYAPLWAGWKKQLVLLGYSKWFYTNSIPYLFSKGLELLKWPASPELVSGLCFGAAALAYLACLRSVWKDGSRDPVRFYRCLFLSYAAFYFQITAPFHDWYLLWALPWLALARWPLGNLLLLLYTAVGLFAYFKRVNFLIAGAVLVYGLALLVAGWTAKRNWKTRAV